MISTLLLMTILPLISNVSLSSSVIEIGHTFQLRSSFTVVVAVVVVSHTGRPLE